MKSREVLYADDGMVLTDGTHYGKVIFVGDGKSAEDYYEITEAGYEAVMAEQNKETTK